MILLSVSAVDGEIFIVVCFKTMVSGINNGLLWFNFNNTFLWGLGGGHTPWHVGSSRTRGQTQALCTRSMES